MMKMTRRRMTINSVKYHLKDLYSRSLSLAMGGGTAVFSYQKENTKPEENITSDRSISRNRVRDVHPVYIAHCKSQYFGLFK